jgi:hypothetical protein
MTHDTRSKIRARKKAAGMKEAREKIKASSIFLTIFLLLFIAGSSFGADTRESTSESSGTSKPPADIWAELFQRTPFPYTMPLPPAKATSIDGTYAKFEPKEIPPVHCRRCPDYAPEGGLWKLNLNEGIFRIYHKVTGWKDMGSFILSGDQLILGNDPVCHEIIGVYQWKLEEGKLILNVIEDKCAIGLRAMNLTKLLWLSCRPPNIEAATTDHWPKPHGCDE